MPLPGFPVFGVDDDLVAVPGLDRGDEPALAQMADLDLPAAALRALPRVAFGDIHRPPGQEHADAEKIGRYELLAAPLPADRREAVGNAARLIGKQVAFPPRRTGQEDRQAAR